jgi:hypothetical protein
MKALASVLALIAICLGLVACGESGEDTTAQDEAAQAKVNELKVEKEKAEVEAELAEKEAEAAKAQAEAQKAKKQKAHAPPTEPAAETEPEPEPEESGGAPNTVGMGLPEARRELEGAGFTVKTRNTDTVLGIIDPSNYTICSQNVQGSTVTVLAQKYGC